MMLLDLSRHTLRRGWATYAGSFIALFLGVGLIGLTVELITAVNQHLSRLGPGHAETRQELDDLASMLGVMAGFSGFIAIFVVASTFAFVVTSRRRELGLLRLVGATPRQVRRMILGESLILATVASFAGCLMAHLLTPPALWLAKERGVTSLSLDSPSLWPTLAIALPIGLLVALIGARAAARRASRIPPVDALRESAVERGLLSRWRVAVGLIFLACSVAMFVVMGSISGEISLVLGVFVPEAIVITVVCFGPVLFPMLARLVAIPMLAATNSVTVRMARDNVAASAKRTASLAAPTLAISAIAGSLIVTLGVMADFDRAVNEDKLRAPVVVTVASNSDEVQRVLEQSPSVRIADGGATVPLTIFRDGEGEQEEAEAIDVAKARTTRGLRAYQGSLDDLHGHTIAMSRSVMFDSGLHLGEMLKVAIADQRPIRVRLAVVVDDAPSLYGYILVPQELARGTAKPSSWFVIPEPGVDDPVRVINTELEGTGAHAESAQAWIANTDTDLRSNNTLVLWVLLGPGGFYAALAIANTLLMGSLQRHREFVSTRLIGATEQQVRAMVLWESTLVTAASLLVGAATTAVVGLLIRGSLSDGVSSIPVDVPWHSLGLVGGICLVVAAVASLAPTAFMLRTVRPSMATD